LSNTADYVVAGITSGLGNQMFQYAAARRLAHVNGAELLLYIVKQQPGTHAVYGLHRFHIGGRLATAAEAGGLKRPGKPRRLLTKVFPLLAPADPEAVREETGLFNPAILDLRRNVKLSGFWQCERYFADIAGIVRQEFTLREPLDAQSGAALARIESGPSAFIHVRRGDYVNNAGGMCPESYYREAVALLRERAGYGLRFYVFSNDPAWAREQKIGGEGAEVIDWNGARPERDLVLMRACQHAIVANSSFSWWGAWLGDGGERIVIAPRVWALDRSDYGDVVPERWLKLG
jgi:Glycosyl transferase family 11